MAAHLYLAFFEGTRKELHITMDEFRGSIVKVYFDKRHFKIVKYVVSGSLNDVYLYSSSLSLASD